MSKTIFITGAASGIGEAVAKRLAKAGHRVVLSDLNSSRLTEICEELTNEGLDVEPYTLDVACQTSIDDLPRAYPDIDVLINNAGIQHVAKLESFPAEKWRQINDILLVGPAMLTRAVLTGMKQRNFGRVINIGSIHALVASPYKSAYVAAKHGVIGFSKVVALETAEFDITINTICPSYVKTPLVDKQISQQAEEHGISRDDVVNNIMLAPMPKKSFIEMDELAETVQYLMSSAARNMTGQSMVLDGGWTVK